MNKAGRKKIILDAGSGETCQNDKAIVRRIIDCIVQLQQNTEKKLIVKWQLFDYIPFLERLKYDVLKYAVDYARDKNLETCVSVFDQESLYYVNLLKVKYLKIACRPNLYHLLKSWLPGNQEWIVSVDSLQLKIELQKLQIPFIPLFCVPEYPANMVKYQSLFLRNLSFSISDHTPDFQLYKKYQPIWYERHFKLADTTGADSGVWASTPEQVEEIL